MNMLERIRRKAYDLAVTAGLAPYKNLWSVPTEKWNELYSGDALDYYGALRQQGRLSVLSGLMRSFPRKPRVLEIGCGDGTFRARMRDDDAESYLGLDISEVAVRKASARGLKRSRFKVGEVPDLADGPFDIISLTDMICYVKDLPALLDALKPHLVSDGWLLVLQFRHPGDIALHRILNKSLHLLDTTDVISPGRPTLAWRVSCYSMSQRSVTFRETPVEALRAGEAMLKEAG